MCDIEDQINHIGDNLESLTQWLENTPDKRWVVKRRSDGATFYGSTPYEAIQQFTNHRSRKELNTLLTDFKDEMESQTIPKILVDIEQRQALTIEAKNRIMETKKDERRNSTRMS